MKLFPLFKSECAKWIAFCGLKGYMVNFGEKELPEGIGARVEVDYPHAYADVYLTCNKDTPLDDAAVKVVAFHEMLHLLLARYTYLACERGVRVDEISEAEEAIVRTLENTVFPLLEKRVK